MSLGTRAAVPLATLGTVVLLAACGSEDTESPAVLPAKTEPLNPGGRMRLTMMDDSCTYEGVEAPASGEFTVEVENRTSIDGSFGLARIRAGATVADLEAYLVKVERRLRQGNGLLPPPPFYAQVARVAVEAGTISYLPADVAAGTYVLTCFASDPPVGIRLGTALDVP